MALPNLTATDEMKKIATSDLPRKEKTDYGYVREVCEYYTYLRCIKQDGILKVAFFFPEHLRLDGSNPAYEVYLDKENRQFITYNSLIQKWSESKLDRLDWKRQYWYTKAYWISDEDETSIQAYLNINKKAVEAIRQFQRNVREEQLEQRHRRETDPWDKDMEQVPELPKDWSRWVDKVAIRQNYIYYHYKKGGAKTGYCTYCEKEVPIKVHPHHNQQGRCICCRVCAGGAGRPQPDRRTHPRSCRRGRATGLSALPGAGSAGGVSAACPTGRHPKPDQRGTQTFRRGRYPIRHCRNSERCMQLPDAAPRRKL